MLDVNLWGKDTFPTLLKTQNSIKTNLKQFWTFLKHKKLNHDLPNYMSLNDASANNGQEIVDLFGK